MQWIREIIALKGIQAIIDGTKKINSIIENADNSLKSKYINAYRKQTSILLEKYTTNKQLISNPPIDMTKEVFDKIKELVELSDEHFKLISYKQDE